MTGHGTLSIPFELSVRGGFSESLNSYFESGRGVTRSTEWSAGGSEAVCVGREGDVELLSNWNLLLADIVATNFDRTVSSSRGLPGFGSPS